MQGLDDAREVERHIDGIFDAASSESRGRLATAVRRLFVETLDFHAANGEVSLAGAAAGMRLPDAAERIAELDGVQVALVRLPASKSGRVRKDGVVAAARALARELGDDLLLAIVDERGERLQLVLPSFEGARPTLRRMTVERDLARRTAVQQVSKIYWRYSDSGNIGIALRQAFDVEPVTREFFAAYKEIFAAAEESISDDKKGRDDRRLFVLTLFNRLMFVYFLQRKGWLYLEAGEERRRDYDYLNALWSAYQASGDSNFYESRLQPLFFNGLNNPDSRNLTRGLDPLIGHVPFLNGGLFERTDPDKVDGVVVPDAIIGRVLRELFDRFNFTVMESTPFDIEVAVDPEMLGKVFEELVTGRHSSGAYYTPRQVVSFMCGEALKGYLKGQVPELDAAAIERFVDSHDTEGLGMAQARRIADALAQVTVADPACGSGAYLLGMMQELIELQSVLYNAGVDAKSLYELKLEIIQRNLYGVDIDAFAVNIAMLRLWLSLAIEHDGDAPEPLPNLEFKIVQGDSLGGPDPSAGVEVQGTLGQDVERIRRLGELKGEYLRESDGGRKWSLRGEIGSLRGELRDAMGATAIDGVVDWRVEFAEVFAGRGGFDVAIANPPYVRQELIGSEKAGLARLDKAALVEQYGDAVVARSDLYCYFYARGLQLLRKGGMHVFVCSNSWLDVGYGARLQEYLLKNAHVQAIYESAVERQFATADINTIISTVGRNWARSDTTHFVSLRAQFAIAVSDSTQRRVISKNRDELIAAGTSGGKYVGDKWGGKYLRAPDIYYHILETYGDKLARLGDVATVHRGITTGANAFFCLTPERIAEFGIEPEYFRPVMTTPQESRSIAVNPAELPKRMFMCHKAKVDLRETGALKYIEWGERGGFNLKKGITPRYRWYNLGERDNVYLGMNKFVNTIARAFLAVPGCLFTDNFQVISAVGNVTSMQLCQAINSTLFQLMLNTESRSNFGEGVLEIQTYETRNLAIVNPELLPKVDAGVFDSTEWDVLAPSAARRQVDDAVFDALGLTSGERDAVYEGVANLVGNRLRRARSV